MTAAGPGRSFQWGTTCGGVTDLNDLHAADLERLWSPGMAPFVGYSSDGGLTWTDQRAEAATYGSAVWFDRTGRAFIRNQCGQVSSGIERPR